MPSLSSLLKDFQTEVVSHNNSYLHCWGSCVFSLLSSTHLEINSSLQYNILVYLLVSMHAVIGQFSGPYSPVRPPKI